MKDLIYPDRVVIGSSNTPAGLRAADSLASVYASWVPRERIVTLNTWSSELSKLVANSMLAQRISSINSISAICEKTGADVDEVAKSIGMDPRIGGKYLKAGIGFGGSCFRKDILSLVYLAETLFLDEVAEYWTQVLNINEWQRNRFVRRVVWCLNGTLAGKKVTVLGYAFKKDTDDTRESPALECIKILLEDTPRELAVFDPFCRSTVIKDEISRLVGKNSLKENGGAIDVYTNAYQACAGSHAVLILSDCDEFNNSKDTKEIKTSKHIPQYSSSKLTKDPRLFQLLEPTELEIIALQEYLTSTSNDADPLQRYIPEPECEYGCQKCKENIGEVVIEGTKKHENEKLDWARIAYHLQKPKWVFDGRGVVNSKEMETLGVRIEVIGKAGWSGASGR